MPKVVALLFCVLCVSRMFGIAYTARICGAPEGVVRESMEQASFTLRSAERSAPSTGALRLRAREDVNRLRDVAIYNGYFDPHIEVHISDAVVPEVVFDVALGNLFTFGTVTCLWSDEDIVRDALRARGEWDVLSSLRRPSPADMPSFRPGKPALGRAIVAMEEELVRALRLRAFAFCTVTRRDVVVDRGRRTVDVVIEVQSGPIVRFGPISVVGAERTNRAVFDTYRDWNEGDLYSPRPLESTERSLQDSGLFQSVQVEESRGTMGPDWAIPVTITVTERKPRTIGCGASYTSTFGGGISAEWEHRNIAGMGRKLSSRLELWQKMRTAVVSYTIPRYGGREQNLLGILEYDHQSYLPFTSSAVQCSALLDRTISPKTNITYGLSLERLESTGIIGHRLYHLVKIPVRLSWTNANSPVDPTRGALVTLHLTPAYQYLQPHFTYVINTVTIAGYHSVAEDSVTFAGRVGLGAIATALNNTIPLPDRFFGGSSTSLRGYRTGSVSPLNKNHEPVGGRSMITGSLEMRVRTRSSLGWVLFYDLGNVYRHFLPSIGERLFLHSIGFGIRYATPIGPLRFDIGVPLQRRTHVDPLFQLYFSIGQAF